MPSIKTVNRGERRVERKPLPPAVAEVLRAYDTAMSPDAEPWEPGALPRAQAADESPPLTPPGGTSPRQVPSASPSPALYVLLAVTLLAVVASVGIGSAALAILAYSARAPVLHLELPVADADLVAGSEVRSVAVIVRADAPGAMTVQHEPVAERPGTEAAEAAPAAPTPRPSAAPTPGEPRLPLAGVAVEDAQPTPRPPTESPAPTAEPSPSPGPSARAKPNAKAGKGGKNGG